MNSVHMAGVKDEPKDERSEMIFLSGRGCYALDGKLPKHQPLATKTVNLTHFAFPSEFAVAKLGLEKRKTVSKRLTNRWHDEPGYCTTVNYEPP